MHLSTDNDGNADYGIGLSLDGVTDLGIGYNEPERREPTSSLSNGYVSLTRCLLGNDDHDIHVGADSGGLGLGRIAANDDLFSRECTVVPSIISSLSCIIFRR